MAIIDSFLGKHFDNDASMQYFAEKAKQPKFLDIPCSHCGEKQLISKKEHAYWCRHCRSIIKPEELRP